jgi:hypothetical protein
MDALASVLDVEIRLGRELQGAEAARVAALLDDASALVRDTAGRTWVDAETGAPLPVPASIRYVVLRMLDRAVRNPNAFSAEAAGDYSYQRTDVQPGVYLTEDERQIIRKAIGKSGLWTQPVTRGEKYLTTVWCEDSFGFELFPIDVNYDC